MTTFTVPTRAAVSEANQNLFDALQKKLGFVPNLYATLALSENALGSYLQFQSAKSSLSQKQREVINLVVSQINECQYCLAAHTAIGGMIGLSADQIIQIRRVHIEFDQKLQALAALVQSIVVNRGRADGALVDAFFAAGYSQENLVDTIVAVGDKIITNYLHNTTEVPVDFPPAPAIESIEAVAA
jgi:uncharacterized peroxidase-related enzyme